MSKTQLLNDTARYFEGNNQDLLSELEQALEQNLFKTRRDQITMCRNLDRYQRGARSILDLKERLSLGGDFGDMENIVKSVFRTSIAIYGFVFCAKKHHQCMYCKNLQ